MSFKLFVKFLWESRCVAVLAVANLELRPARHLPMGFR